MNENELMKALDKSSDATQVPLDSFGLIKVGDWVWGEGGFGQVTQIFHDYYEEYDDLLDDIDPNEDDDENDYLDEQEYNDIMDDYEDMYEN